MRGSAGPAASPEEPHRDGPSRRPSGPRHALPAPQHDRRREPAMSDRDLDAEFARIIAGWDDEAPEPQRRDAGATSSDQAADQAAEQVAAPAPPSVSLTEADTADEPGPPSAPDASPS